MDLPAAPFIQGVRVVEGRLRDYAASLPAVRSLVERSLELDPRVTFFVGENGSGKSTLVEAIAVAAGLNPEGGGRRARFATHASHSELSEAIELDGASRPMNEYFLRAESLYNVATAIETKDDFAFERAAFERPLHEQSHGESFLAVALERFGPRGLYILDEPEAAFSLQGQLAFMRRMHDLVAEHSQFLVATHSPILLGYPEATIYELGPDGIEQRAYEDTEQYQLTRAFLEDRGRFLHHLLGDDDANGIESEEAR